MPAPGLANGRAIGKFFVVAVFVFFILLGIANYVYERNTSIAVPIKTTGGNLDSYQSQLVALAQNIFNTARISGQDMSSGPCLSNNLAGEWVVDVVHDPRQATDDLPENQCPAFLANQATKIITFSPEGKFLGIK